MSTIRLDSLSRWQEGKMQLAARVGDTLVGLVDLYNYDPIHHRAEVGIVVDSQHRGHGYARAILLELDRYVQQHLLLHQLYCDILDSNTVSQHLFEESGYILCGTFAEWVSDDAGNYFSVKRYQKLI